MCSPQHTAWWCRTVCHHASTRRTLCRHRQGQRGAVQCLNRALFVRTQQGGFTRGAGKAPPLDERGFEVGTRESLQGFIRCGSGSGRPNPLEGHRADAHDAAEGAAMSLRRPVGRRLVPKGRPPSPECRHPGRRACGRIGCAPPPPAPTRQTGGAKADGGGHPGSNPRRRTPAAARRSPGPTEPIGVWGSGAVPGEPE